MPRAAPESTGRRTCGSGARRAGTGADRRCWYPESLLQRSPNLFGGVDAQLELGLFLLDRQVVAVVGTGEAALRREAQALERHDSGRRLDAPLESILVLELRHLGAHQPQHHPLALGDMAQ